MARIYVASSWRNKYQQDVVAALRKQGHGVYDFRNPDDLRGKSDKGATLEYTNPVGKGFHWSDIDPNWKNWTPSQFRDALKHPIAQHGFDLDADAMEWCNAGLLVVPSGRSSHFEAGWIGGSRKPVAIYIPELPEPELMYKLCELTTRHNASLPHNQIEILITMEEVLDYYSHLLPAHAKKLSDQNAG